MNSKSRLWQFLLDKGQATNAQIAEFMRGTKGQLSWGQRLRELRQELQRKGGDIACQEIKPGIYLYRVILPEPPRPELEQALADNHLAEETAINLAEAGR